MCVCENLWDHCPPECAFETGDEQCFPPGVRVRIFPPECAFETGDEQKKW